MAAVEDAYSKLKSVRGKYHQALKEEAFLRTALETAEELQANMDRNTNDIAQKFDAIRAKWSGTCSMELVSFSTLILQCDSNNKPVKTNTVRKFPPYPTAYHQVFQGSEETEIIIFTRD